MKEHISQLIQTALEKLQAEHALATLPTEIQVTHTKSPEHGDFSCNVAMILAKQQQKNPRDMAQLII
ncbi:MAG TPA: arginine--tRNA ligase, partial [Gammaproteobacteria bacterium]|nr:arginine--tRNA ligase [Gammaproteobacteria bacterium]